MMMKPLQIGDLCIERPVILAPMAGVTDLPFRVLCREQGCGMVCTEMVSAKAITYKNKNTFLLMETVPQERPVSLRAIWLRSGYHGRSGQNDRRQRF